MAELVAVVGSPRQGKATDLLVDKAIEGANAANPELSTTKINLADYDINFCRNCLACRETPVSGPVARCSIRDDMDRLNDHLVRADSLIFGTPVHMGYATALMMTFLERICWTFAYRGASYLDIKGCPSPRSEKRRKAVQIVVSGIIPPRYKWFCNQAKGQIKTICRDSLNARTKGHLYAGDIEHLGVERYFEKAFRLGGKVA